MHITELVRSYLSYVTRTGRIISFNLPNFVTADLSKGNAEYLKFHTTMSARQQFCSVARPDKLDAGILYRSNSVCAPRMDQFTNIVLFTLQSVSLALCLKYILLKH